MALAPGTRLGPYEITAAIGAGGMGEVYRATDTNLKRDVAIKILPEAFAADPDRLARFTREAQVLASLNHPHIAAIYGVEERALVLELVEGPALDARLAQGPIPWEEALPLIRQLIDALDAAHMKGVIHRDLKPANIKVTAEGQLKVLDFGLAKAMSPDDAALGSALANSPTLTFQAATVAGVILGTAAYMSPEQARGKAVDKRADIWALGVVVYEMLTGRPLFEGESVSDVLAQTLTKPIDLNGVPPQARRLLSRCLDRDRRTRLRDVGDALDLLEAPAPSGTPAPRHARIWMAAAVAGLTLAAVFAALWQRDSARHEPERALRISLAEAGPFSLLSPDGSAVVSSDGDALRVRRLDDLLPRSLPGTEGAVRPFWAGDSSAIGFFQQGKVCIQSLDAAGIRCLAPAPEPGGGSWRGTAANGDIVFASGAKLLHVNLTSGALRELPVTLPAGQRPLNPSFLPAGDDVVVTAGPPDSDALTLYRVSLASGALARLMETPYAVEFARHPRSGQWYMLYASPLMSSGMLIPALMAVRVDPATGQASGTPVQLVDGVGINPAAHLMAAATSDSGRIIVRRHRMASPVFRIRWYAPDGKVLASLGDKMACSGILLSPDERSVAAITGYPRRNIVIFDARSGDSRRLTTAADSIGQGMAWAPDSATLYYQIGRPDGTWDIVRQDATGGTRPEAIGHADFAVTLMDISPDGKYLLFGPNATTGSSFYWLRTDGRADSRPEPWATGMSSGVANARFTPDGKFVFANTGRLEARFIPWRPDQPAATVDARAVTFSAGGRFFSRDGKRLCGVGQAPGVTCSSVTAAPDGTPLLGPPSMQFGGVTTMSGIFDQMGAVASDGRFLLIATDEADEFGWQFLTDWTLLLPGAAR